MEEIFGFHVDFMFSFGLMGLFFRNSFYQRRYYFLIIILVIYVAFYIFQEEAECANPSKQGNVENLQNTVRDIIGGMEENEVNVVGQVLFGENPGLNFHPAQGWPEQTNVVPPLQPNPWISVLLFATLSAAVTIISLYHQEIINFLFSTGRDLARGIIPILEHGFYPRETVMNRALQLAQTPEGYQRVIDAINFARSLPKSA